MTQVTSLKAQATNLAKALSDMGIKLTKAQSLEVLAQQYGVKNWDTLSGMLKTKAAPTHQPTLADMPFFPDNVWVEQGSRVVLCDVIAYEEQGLSLLHDLPSLHKFLDEFKGLFIEGMDSLAIQLNGDGRDYEFTFNDLVGLTYQNLGGQGNWKLADGKTYLRFMCGSTWTPDAPSEEKDTPLTIPAMVKSAKGCRLLVVTSHDGDFYDIRAIVPPHLDIEVIKQKVEQELKRLKQLDKENEDNPDYAEYTDSDVKKFISSLGCEPVDPEMCSVNWDV